MNLRQRTRPLRHFVTYAFARAVFAVTRLLPLRWALRLVGIIGRVCGFLAVRPRRAMARRLSLADLSEKPKPSEIFGELSKRVLEFAQSDRLLPKIAITPQARALLAGDDPLLVASFHIWNWELTGARLVQVQGRPVHAIAAASHRSPLLRFVAERRAKHGISIHAPGQGARAVSALRAGALLVVLVDQKTREKSEMLPFLGRPAPCSLTFARLQAITHARPIAIWMRQTPAGFELDGEALDPTRDLTAQVTRRAESEIRACPRAFVWNHDRWGDEC